MFTLAGNGEIGAYLRTLIREKGYEKDADFARDYLEKKYGEEYTEDILKTTKNTFSKIFNGKSCVTIEQLADLSRLLCVSCEEILSAGRHYEPTANHITNYEIAKSKDRKVWDEYMKREDRLFLNCDEYRKSVIDYALEFENYEFIKYLLDEGYIWFVSESHGNYDILYGAGTSIQSNWKRFAPVPDAFISNELFEQDRLRTQTAVLAIQNGDCDILDSLRAREIPELHNFNTFISSSTDFNEKRNDDLIEAIAVSQNEKIIDYFSKEFVIKSPSGNENTYMFPYLRDVIEKMIKYKNYKLAEVVVRRAIVHNKNIYIKISDIINEYCNYFNELYGVDDRKRKINKNDFRIKDDLVWVMIFTPPISLRTNIIQVENSKCSLILSELINELNEWHDKIISMGGEENG